MRRTVLLLSVVLLATVTAARVVTLVVETKPAKAAFQGGNGRIFYERSGSVWSMNPDGTGQTELVGVNDSNSEGRPAVSPNGTRVAYEKGHDIWVMSHAGTNPKRLTDGVNTSSFDSGEPAWSPDGTHIAFSRSEDGFSDDYDIWVMNPDGSRQVNLTNTPKNEEYEPAWSPDGLEIAYTRLGCDVPNAGGLCVYKMFANGLGQTNLTNPEDDIQCQDGSVRRVYGWSEDPSWSPDGSKIAFWGPISCKDASTGEAAGTGTNIWVMNSSDGSEKKDLTQDEGTGDRAPSWSPDGSKIVFVSDRDDPEFGFGYRELYTIDADADEPLSGLKRLTRSVGEDDELPDWGIRPNASLAMLPQVPGVMRHFGWLNGARLQAKWFAGPPRVLGEDFQVNTHAEVLDAPKDTTTIKMDSWVLTFPRAKAKYDELVRERACMNKAAQDEIREMLERQGKLLDKQRKSFGNLDAPVPNQDWNYVQQRPVSTSFTQMRRPDDMAAALGDFNLRCVVAGDIVPNPSRPEYMIVIKELGVYVRDSYDFNGFQPLGFWRADPPYASGEPASGAVSLSNSTYREWRRVNGEGGDYLVFSNRKKVTLNTTFRFLIDCRAPRPCEVIPGSGSG